MRFECLFFVFDVIYLIVILHTLILITHSPNSQELNTVSWKLMQGNCGTLLHNQECALSLPKKSFKPKPMAHMSSLLPSAIRAEMFQIEATASSLVPGWGQHETDREKVIHFFCCKSRKLWGQFLPWCYSSYPEYKLRLYNLQDYVNKP